jgi:hypothetical protein
MSAEPLLNNFCSSVGSRVQATFPYDAISIEDGQRPIGFRFVRHIVNINASLAGNDLIITGEADTLELARAKARSELIERSALISFGHNYGAETSNGWAAHPDKDQAHSNAILELVERDAVLAQWYSSTPFFELKPSEWPLDIKHWAASELARSEFPRLRLLISTQGLGPSVTCLFMNASGHGVSAHATRSTLDESIRSAITEACRPAHASIRREHWKNTLALKAGDGNPRSSEAHAVYYAYHEPFPQWIFGEELNWDGALNLWRQRMLVLVADDQFDFTIVMTEPMFVGFARHPKAFHLRWGNTNPEWIASLSGSKRLGLSKDKINKSVHIIA